MPPASATLLCSYHYDPLDRLVACAPTAQAVTQRFYLKNRLATEIQGVMWRSIMQHNDQLIAQQQRQSRAVQTLLLATDQQRSVLNSTHPARAYNVYGYRPAQNGLLSLLGFNGERSDPVTGWYLLGKGYRPFNPVLMCFVSPDSWSPFGKGGLNAYAYCERDPVNRSDPTGRASFLVLLEKLKFWKSTVKRSTNRPATYDWLGGTYKKTEPTDVQLKKQLTSQDNVGDEAVATHLPDLPEQTDVYLDSARQAFVEREQTAIKQLLGSLENPHDPNSGLTRIIIGVRDERALRHARLIKFKRPTPAKTRSNIRYK
jgi:RHS repeat-associated protein